MTKEDLALLLQKPGYGLAVDSRPRTLKVEPAPALAPTIALNAPRSAGKRLRQDSKGPNKTEAAFFEYLKARYSFATIHLQSVTLKLGNGVRYTPDAFAFFADGPEAWEVKGFMRDDAAVKLKVAAAIYKTIKFHLVSRDKKAQGGWNIQAVLP